MSSHLLRWWSGRHDMLRYGKSTKPEPSTNPNPTEIVQLSETRTARNAARQQRFEIKDLAATLSLRGCAALFLKDGLTCTCTTEQLA